MLKALFRLLAALSITFSGTAHAQFGPSVWEQLQLKGDRTLLARIEKLDLFPGKVLVGFREVANNGMKGEMELCRPEADLQESWASVVNNQRIETLRQAFKSGELVELSFKGPWSPCLSFISVIK